MDVNVKVPRPLKPKVLLCSTGRFLTKQGRADVSYRDMQEIDQIQSIPDLESVLCRVFHIDIPEPRRGVLLELHVQTVLFCRENRFNREQTSALLSIVKCMHQANTETSLSNMEQCFEFFSELLLCHSVRRPPFSINLFNSAEVTRILKYIHSTYIRHYNLYKYIFTPQVRLDLSLTYSGMLEEEDIVLEDTAVPDMEKVMEKESEELRYEDQGIEIQAPSTTGLDVEVTTPGSKSELRAMIQQEVREELVRVSGQLEERLKESADHLNSTLASLQPSLQGNK